MIAAEPFLKSSSYRGWLIEWLQAAEESIAHIGEGNAAVNEKVVDANKQREDDNRPQTVT
jgi:hypothetical protein